MLVVVLFTLARESAVAPLCLCVCSHNTNLKSRTEVAEIATPYQLTRLPNATKSMSMHGDIPYYYNYYGCVWQSYQYDVQSIHTPLGIIK